MMMMMIGNMTSRMINLDADNCHGRAGAGDVQQHLPKTAGIFDLCILYFYIIVANKQEVKAFAFFRYFYIKILLFINIQQHLPKTAGIFDLCILYFYIKILHFAFLILYQNLCIFTLTTISSTSQKMNATLQYDERFLNLPVLIEQIVLQSVK